MIPVDAELSACVMATTTSASARATLLASLDPPHFAQGPCADFWRMVQRHEAEGKPRAAAAILEALQRDGASAPQSPDGWRGWFLDARERARSYLVRGGITPDERAEELVRDVRNAAELREIRRVCLEVSGRTETLREMASDLRGELVDRVSAAKSLEAGKHAATLRDSGQMLVDQLLAKEDPATPAPWPELERCIRLRPGSLTILAAATGMGKTTIAMQFARACVAHGDACFFVNCEMTEAEMHSLLAGQEHGCPVDPRNDLERAELLRAVTATVQAKIPMYWACEADLTIEGACIRAKALHAQLAEDGKRLGLIIVDYIGGIPNSPEEARSKLRRDEILGARALRLKTLARTLEVPVLALAQLNREAEKAGSRANRGMIGDSYDILRHPDHLLIFSRPMPNQEDGAGTVPAISIQKHRRGKPGFLPLEWQPKTETYEIAQ